MTATSANSTSGTAAWADALLLSFAQAGYIRAEPAILQPAEAFVDLSGEDIRKSLYLTSDASGEELCLRPDLTIPVARDYLASPRAGQPAGFSYLGPVFRYRCGRTERVSAGRHRILRPAGPRRGRCRDAGAGAGSDRRFWGRQCRNPHRRRRPVQFADRCAAALPGLAAAADQGLQPQDRSRPRHRAAHAEHRAGPQRI